MEIPLLGISFHASAHYPNFHFVHLQMCFATTAPQCFDTEYFEIQQKTILTKWLESFWINELINVTDN